MILWRPGCVHAWVVVRRLGDVLRLARWHTRALLGVLYIRTHSQRETWRWWSTPHGFAYCESPNGRWFGSPAGQYSFLVLRQSMSGTARLFPHRLVSAGPHALAATRPLGHSPAFPHPDERHVYFVDSFIGCTSQGNARTKSHALTLSGHTPQWLAIYHPLMVKGCRLAFTLSLVHVHQFSRLDSNR